MTVTGIAVAICGILMITGAATALFIRNLTAAVVMSGAVGLIASLLYLFLGSPDVAMTEAAIGSGLTTVVFLFALSRIRKNAQTENTAKPTLKDKDDSGDEVLYD